MISSLYYHDPYVRLTTIKLILRQYPYRCCVDSCGYDLRGDLFEASSRIMYRPKVARSAFSTCGKHVQLLRWASYKLIENKNVIKTAFPLV